MSLFELEPNPTFVVPVDIPIPGSAPGRVNFRFKHMETDAFYDMLNESRAKGEPAADFLARFVDGWEGGTIIAPFSRESLEKLVRKYPKSARAIFRAFEAELIGALEKN